MMSTPTAYPSSRFHDLMATARFEVMPTAKIEEQVLANVPKDVTVTAAQNKGMEAAARLHLQPGRRHRALAAGGAGTSGALTSSGRTLGRCPRIA
jgi:hypothetical protein